MNWRIPLFDPELGEREVAALRDVITSKWLTQGEQTEAFEGEFAEFIGTRFGVAVNSCTAALHISLQAAGITAGDEVICPSLTFVATANAVRYCGAEPVFADVGSFDEWVISIDTIQPLITDRTKAIIVVHYAGYLADMAPIVELASKLGIHLIEDVAHAPGASRNGRFGGAWGNTGAFSFFSNKNMTTGEGGMLTTNDESTAELARKLRCHGMTSVTLDRHKGHNFSYDVVELGYNYRMSELNAALGRVQLGSVIAWNQRRAELVRYYRNCISDFEDVLVPFLNTPGEHAYHIFPILLPEEVERTSIMAALRDEGIQTSIHYRPVHHFTSYCRDNRPLRHPLPLTDAIGNRVLTLPLYPSMHSRQIDSVCDALKRYLRD